MTPKYSLRKGTKILNRYEILRYISSGGFGITYEAFDLLSKRRIAIKELYITEICNRESDALTVTINDTNKPTFFAHRRKFLDEAKRLMELSHPNIIKVSDVFEANGTAYFAMDYIEGKPLSKEVVPMSENIAIFIINPILDALEYIHNKGVLHLDIKPSNIMIDKHGKVILIDFGTSKVYGDADGKSLSLSTTLAFTPGYAPLEQMSVSTVKNLGTYSDIYAIGATLYYLLSGSKPLLPGEILENDEKLPRIENITTETQNAIWQATKVVRTTRIATVEQLRRALAGEIIDVKAEELQRKEEKRRRREEIERRRKQEEERRRREEIERRRKQEEERRRREEIERHRKQEEERRRREIANDGNTIPINKERIINPHPINPHQNNAQPINKRTKNPQIIKKNTPQKKEKSNNKVFTVILATLIGIAAIAIVVYFYHIFTNEPVDKDSVDTPIVDSINLDEPNKENSTDLVTTDTNITPSISPNTPTTPQKPVLVPAPPKKRIIQEPQTKPKIQPQTKQPVYKQAKPQTKQPVYRQAKPQTGSVKPKNHATETPKGSAPKDPAPRVNSDPFNKGSKNESKVNTNPFNKEQNVNTNPLNSSD